MISIKRNVLMTPELKEVLIKVYTSSLEAHNRRWEYLTLPLDERFTLIQEYIDEKRTLLS